MLDPTRLKLGAEAVGYQLRCGRAVDWDSFKTALQTDYNNQGSAVQVRRERETPQNEIHSMGAQLNGQEGNSLMLTNARQMRQINGYPLRHFDANNPAVILPVKYGGLPMYNPKQVASEQYVSRFTEPLSAQLDSSTELLSRQGLPALTSDVSRPYQKHFFMNPLTATKQELESNASVFKQRMHLQRMKGKGRSADQPVISIGRNFFNKSSQHIIRGADGVPYTYARDDVESEQMEEQSGFMAAQLNFGRRVSDLMNRNNGKDPAAMEYNGKDPAAMESLRTSLYAPQGDDLAMMSSSPASAASLQQLAPPAPYREVNVNPANYDDYSLVDPVDFDSPDGASQSDARANALSLIDSITSRINRLQGRVGSMRERVGSPEFDSGPSTGFATPLPTASRFGNVQGSGSNIRQQTIAMSNLSGRSGAYDYSPIQPLKLQPHFTKKRGKKIRKDTVVKGRYDFRQLNR